MNVRIEIWAAGDEPPPAGSPVLVQVLDTLMQDEDARVLAEARGVSKAGSVIAVAELEVPDDGDLYPTVYVHVDVDRDDSVSAGDFITMQSYPCRGGEMKVDVRKVR